MNIPSIESLLAELDKYKRAYESADAQILSLKEQRNRLTAERDEWEANSGQWEQEYYKASAERDRFANMISENSNRWQEMMAALREAKEALTPYMKFVDGTQVKNHPAKVYDRINKVLGDE